MLKSSALLVPLVVAWLTPAPVSKSPSVADFELYGSATVQGEDCVRLTPDEPWVSGAAWSKEALDLDEPFDVEVKLAFGNRDALGADGIVFVLTTDRRAGWRGEGMGFAGLSPSLGIELDTYQNRRQNDPAADHLALLVDGVPYHHGADAHVVQLPNLEDGARHALRVQWSPKANALTVSVDGEKKASYPGAILRRVFGADSMVHWGFTAGTGRKSNPHDVCFSK